MFSSHIGITDYIEAEVLAILEALQIFQSYFQQIVKVESDSFNAISWLKSLEVPWKLQFYFNKIKAITSTTQVSFAHVSKSANGMADSQAK